MNKIKKLKSCVEQLTELALPSRQLQQHYDEIDYTCVSFVHGKTQAGPLAGPLMTV